KLGTSFRVPSNLNDGNVTSFQLLNFMIHNLYWFCYKVELVINTQFFQRRAYVQEKIIEGSNAPNETGNVQRTLRTSSSGNTSTDEARVILTDEQNDFLFADASMMEEIEELNANICLMARIQPADNTSDAGPSYDSAYIS
ncbi:hypothetical protein Tco_0314077, partial [Tanacetum coccineum]